MLARRLAIQRIPCNISTATGSRGLTTALHLAAKQLPPRPKLEDTDITENFVKGTGPGGQKINKTASAVQLIHHPTGMVIKCQATRSRIQNRKIARNMLAERLELAEKGDESRVAQKLERAKKKKASATKKSKRKYRKLAEAKDIAASADQSADQAESGRAVGDFDTSDPEQSDMENVTAISSNVHFQENNGHGPRASAKPFGRPGQV